MKKKMYYLPLMLLALLGAIQYGCEKEAEEICEPFDACDAPPATACCTDNECYYEYDGKTYSFKNGDEDEEDKAMADLIADMCGIEEEDETSAVTIEIEDRLKAQTQRLLSEARADAICN